MHIINLGPKFLKFFDQLDQNQHPMEQYLQFKEYFRGDIYYEIICARLERKSVESAADHLKNHLSYFSLFRDKFVQYSDTIETILSNGEATFQNLFSDYTVNCSVLTGHSLGSFDGATRQHGDQLYLLFGFDVMTSIYTNIRIDPFIIHELFHDYHNMKFNEGEGDNLLGPLWSEGLATYISHQVFPDASRQELILDFPEGLIPKVEDNIVELCKELEHQLLDAEDGGYTRFFAGPFDEQNYRAGYYLGFLFVHYIAADHTLQEIVELSFTELIDPARKFLQLCRSNLSSVKATYLNFQI